MSYSNKGLKTEAYYACIKEKVAISPSASSYNPCKYVSSHLCGKDNFSHMINKMSLKDSTQPKAGSEGLKFQIS